MLSTFCRHRHRVCNGEETCTVSHSYRGRASDGAPGKLETCQVLDQCRPLSTGPCCSSESQHRPGVPACPRAHSPGLPVSMPSTCCSSASAWIATLSPGPDPAQMFHLLGKFWWKSPSQGLHWSPRTLPAAHTAPAAVGLCLVEIHSGQSKMLQILANTSDS